VEARSGARPAAAHRRPRRLGLVLSEIHPDAAQGFSAGAEAYERGRPGYPDAAVSALVARFAIGPGRRVLDVGAGTGKLTRLLLPTGCGIEAVEPVANMRSGLVAAVPGVPVHAGTGEALPVDDASFDVVVAAQAFHWFDPPRALAEVARVLLPGGGLALLWNHRDECVPWVAELTRIIHWDTFERGQYHRVDWAAVVAESSSRFTPLQRQQFPYAQDLDEEGLVDRVASVSYIASMPEDGRADILARVRSLVADFPPRFELPYVTDLWTADVTPA
jgi:SAM-dependent methyltransferase